MIEGNNNGLVAIVFGSCLFFNYYYIDLHMVRNGPHFWVVVDRHETNDAW